MRGRHFAQSREAGAAEQEGRAPPEAVRRGTAREPRHPAAAAAEGPRADEEEEGQEGRVGGGARAQARAEAVWAAAARAPSTAADAWAAVEALRGDQGPQAPPKTSGRARREDPAPQAQSEKSARPSK